MADVLLSALVNTLLENLSSSSLEEIGIVGALKTEVENLQSTLSTIQVVLQDAEEKQLKSGAIKNWLGKLKHTAYSLEDVLDEFKTEAQRRSLHKDAISQVSTFFSPQNPLLFRFNMARKFKNVREKLDAIAGERTKFHLREGVEYVEIQPKEERQTSSLVEESGIYGRANEKEMIVNMLLNNSSHRDDLSVYAIWGMGGLGKTTVAQLVYNDERVKKAFHLRVWVCVSDDFDIERLTKAIVESIEGNTCNLHELDPLQRRLEEKLEGKRFLLVLDDVWNEYHDKWDGLKQALRRGVKGSTVIVTTRIEKVALMMETVNSVFRLGCLSDDDAWSLFKERAFGVRRNEDTAYLETIGRQIVKKCGGVPLAIKAIGSIMRLKSQESEWLHVKDNEIWDSGDEASRILDVLRLSYKHLPPYLRQCFSFCSIFPKDYVMSKQRLIELWMANGFIPYRRSMGLHEMGCEIFNELTWRSFFQEVKEDIDGNVTCKMHDLIHDVATSIMGHECCVIERNDEMSKVQKTTRHLFVEGRSSSRTIVDMPKLQSLRSLILCSSSYPSHLINQKYLKVLHFGRYFHGFKGNYPLKHLRYLNLSSSMIRMLPESTSGLYNLQTLDLRYCQSLRMLPKGMKSLKNLHYLDIRGCDSLTCMPAGLAKLSCLRKLSIFIVGTDKGLRINELKELALEGELSIKALNNVKTSAEAKNANLIEKPNLRSLSLSWQVNSEEKSQNDNAEDVLNGLLPHSSLKKLCINGYQGLRFPYWMKDLLLPNLVQISLGNCARCEQLPPLGKLRFLKKLSLSQMGALRSVDSNFYGDGESSFPSLEMLTIYDAPCLEEWTAGNGRDNFPLLSSLTIRHCPQLVKLPVPMLQSLKGLSIQECSFTLHGSLTLNATFHTSLVIRKFHDLMDLPDGLLQNQKQLYSLSIESSSRKSLSNLLDNLSTLKHLSLSGCSELESLPAGLQNVSTLETLGLYNCGSLISLPVNVLHGLSSLSSLEIDNCKKLASLPEGVRYLSSLRSLRIWRCEGLMSLPNEIEHLALLSDLGIDHCPKLTSLPESIQHLSSLRSLSISHCEGLMSVPNEIEHLALLSDLEIYHCPKLTSLPESIQHLSSLRSLRIGHCEGLMSVPNEIEHLALLSDLGIHHCPKLTSLPESIQHLSSLRSLQIADFEGLISLPNEIEHLALLSDLRIWSCPNLRSLPQGIRRLTALKSLEIGECPYLEKRCKKERGEDWPNIAHIPSVTIYETRGSCSSVLTRVSDWTCGLSRKF